MAFLCGPRQVGKTTAARKEVPGVYINWDDQTDRQIILKGPNRVYHHYKLADFNKSNIQLVFDEIHKYPRWKQFLKGFFDKYQGDFKVLVTGSARLNVFKRGGDSLMGRYFLYRMHPLSVGEMVRITFSQDEIQQPTKVEKDLIPQLLKFGGFPEPFLKGDQRFYNRWKRMRTEQFFYEDVRDSTNINAIAQLEILSEILKERAGQLVNYSTLSNEIQVTVNTVKKWIETLESLYFCFRVRPWSNNIPKGLRKQPKIYLWDWSYISDQGAKLENFIASHLLKAAHFWTDVGFGDYGVYFLRDKMKREVDFLMIRNHKPWFIVEVKSSANKRISPALEYFKNILGIDHAFQVDFGTDFIQRDCFQEKRSIRVPAATLLSQLV
ncbi:MAG TPA: ATP-binding protein [Desulfobacterales bacterium]|nr:ATP-binding protein [Desulfobacterales bacterium]